MDKTEINAVVASALSVSDKIRALAGGGLPRAEIARLLGKRYQHVRNVLEADKLRRQPQAGEGPSGVAEAARPFGGPSGDAHPDVEGRGGGAYRLVVREDGSVVIPEAVRATLGVNPGQPLMARFDGEALNLVNAATALRRAQELIRPYIVEGVSVVDELIAERRREAAREDSDD
jgi:bifunctional DNA-binding transcriptional regulator/antitoxin component of YhaV-PrlF toxin-antitoxin module